MRWDWNKPQKQKVGEIEMNIRKLGNWELGWRVLLDLQNSGNELSLDLYKSGNELSLDLHKSSNEFSLDLHKSGNELSLDLHKFGNELSLALHINESPKWNSSLLDFFIIAYQWMTKY